MVITLIELVTIVQKIVLFVTMIVMEMFALLFVPNVMNHYI